MGMEAGVEITSGIYLLKITPPQYELNMNNTVNSSYAISILPLKQLRCSNMQLITEILQRTAKRICERLANTVHTRR